MRIITDMKFKYNMYLSFFIAQQSIMIMFIMTQDSLGYEQAYWK